MTPGTSNRLPRYAGESLVLPAVALQNAGGN